MMPRTETIMEKKKLPELVPAEAFNGQNNLHHFHILSNSNSTQVKCPIFFNLLMRRLLASFGVLFKSECLMTKTTILDLARHHAALLALLLLSHLQL